MPKIGKIKGGKFRGFVIFKIVFGHLAFFSELSMAAIANGNSI